MHYQIKSLTYYLMLLFIYRYCLDAMMHVKPDRPALIFAAAYHSKSRSKCCQESTLHPTYHVPSLLEMRHEHVDFTICIHLQCYSIVGLPKEPGSTRWYGESWLNDPVAHDVKNY